MLAALWLLEERLASSHPGHTSTLGPVGLFFLATLKRAIAHAPPRSLTRRCPYLLACATSYTILS